jgi:hypothetical protein
MGDNLRRYRAIKGALKQLYPKDVKGNQARHMNTLAGLISGIVGSRRVNLPEIARKVPDGTNQESRVKRFSRWLHNERIEAEVYFMPFAQDLLVRLAERTLVFAIDGSEVGRKCVTLMLSVLYKKRALPLVWVVVKGTKGHFPEDTHVLLVEQLQTLVPEGADVIFLGDGEFDGVGLQAALADCGWEYVCRTAKNIQLCEEDSWFTFEDLDLRPGRCLGIPDVQFTQQAYGPVLAVAWWDGAFDAPIFLVTNMDLAEEACYWYRKRFHIETFFSDQKTRGFHLHKSHIADPRRLARLMVAACLAYIWTIFLGVLAKRDGWVAIIHRPDRCDLSLFQLGLALLEHFLNEDLPIPVAFQMPVLEGF